LKIKSDSFLPHHENVFGVFFSSKKTKRKKIVKKIYFFQMKQNLYFVWICLTKFSHNLVVMKNFFFLGFFYNFHQKTKKGVTIYCLWMKFVSLYISSIHGYKDFQREDISICCMLVCLEYIFFYLTNDLIIKFVTQSSVTLLLDWHNIFWSNKKKVIIMKIFIFLKLFIHFFCAKNCFNIML